MRACHMASREFSSSLFLDVAIKACLCMAIETGQYAYPFFSFAVAVRAPYNVCRAYH